MSDNRAMSNERPDDAPASGSNPARVPAFLPGIKPQNSLNFEGNKLEHWPLWKQQWANYVVISRLDTQSQDYQTAMLLNSIGTDALKVFNGFVFAPNETRDVSNILRKFDEHIIGQLNETYERYRFNCRNQTPGEAVDAFITALRNLAKNCNFCECMRESLLRDRVIMGILDSDLRKRLLQMPDLTINLCIDMCRAYEATETRMRYMEGSSQVEVHTVKPTRPSAHSTKGKMRGQPRKQAKCRFCGKTHEMTKESCPAWGKLCSKCNGRNHFAIVCQNKGRVHVVNAERQDDNAYELLNGVTTVNNVKPEKAESPSKPLIFAEMCIDGKRIKFQVDSGASVNLIPACHIGEAELSRPTKVLQMWDKSLKTPLGECRVKMINPANNKKYAVLFTVVNEDLMPVLGASASQQMGLITVNRANIRQVTATNREADILEKYKDVFNDDVGHFPGKAHLEVDATVKPVITPARKIPFALRPRLKDELDQLTEKGVIAPVNEPTEWVSALALATKKSGELRICIDPRPLNKALRREHYKLPTLDDVLPELSKARIITTVDLKSGYWHVELDEESSKLTTFATPHGRFRWLRLPFGTNVSAEIFAKRLHDCVHDLPGLICVADDIMVYGVGSTDEEAMIDHDVKLEKLLQRCLDIGIRLNASKMKLRQRSVTFLGHIITKDGLMADPAKIEAIRDMPCPTDVAGVQRLNGFVNYLAKFLPGLSDVMEPIRQLTKTDVPWNWSKTQEDAFEAMKRLVSEAPVLRFYDPDKELSIQCDASQTGLGAALLQDGQPLAFVSRALTDTETRYAQLEKEMLAVVWSIEKFDQYTYGRRVNMISDHKPLESIMKKALANAPKRLQGMMMRLQKYDINLIYVPGKHLLLADTLSRAYRPTTDGRHDDFEHVHALQYMAMTDSRLEAIRVATEADEVMTALKQIILKGWPDERIHAPPLVQIYFAFRDELAIHDGIVFRGERVVVPASQRSVLKEKIHSSHLGIDGCLRRAKECLFWPNMTSEIREYISTCSICRTYETANQRETLMSHDIPDRPWAKVGTDLFAKDGRDYLITVDYYSNFWEVDLLPSTESTMVINKLKNHFARYGIPDTIVSDGGPQYVSHEFAKFCKSWDIIHVTSSPYNSKANGKTESAVKTCKQIMRKSKDACSDPYLAILDHRNTPSQGFLSSPAQRLMSRRTKTLLPTASALLRPEVVDARHTERDMKRSQTQQATYYNKRASDSTLLGQATPLTGLSNKVLLLA